MTKHDHNPQPNNDSPPPLDLAALGITPDADTNRGRPGPGKYTPERLQRIYYALTQGATRQHAAYSSGIHEATFTAWMTEKAGFPALVKKAEEVYIAGRIGTIERAADKEAKQWTASAWLLERRWPNRFGRVDRVAVDLHHSGGIAQLAEHRPGELADQLAHLVKRVTGGAAPPALPQPDVQDVEPEDDDPHLPLALMP